MRVAAYKKGGARARGGIRGRRNSTIFSVRFINFSGSIRRRDLLVNISADMCDFFSVSLFYFVKIKMERELNGIAG